MTPNPNSGGVGLISLPPTISVIISTYNRASMLDKALASVCAQTYDDFDVWVIDDASPADSGVPAILEKWNSLFLARGIEFYAASLDTNSGYQCVPKNAGIFYSMGDFIAYLDDDNTWEADHLTTMMEAMTPDVDMVYCGINYINETDNESLNTGRWDAQPWEPLKLNDVNYIDTSAIMHSRGSCSMLSSKAFNVWNEELRRYGDWNLVVRFAQLGLRAKPVSDLHINYVWHGENLQLTRKPSGVYAKQMSDFPLEAGNATT